MSLYVVTGGAGFIGSHLCEELVRRGERVRVVDSLITGKRANLAHLPQDDPKGRQPDITRAKTVLGWEPRVDFDEGIRKTIEYFRTRLT